jgi:hypothetical protein
MKASAATAPPPATPAPTAPTAPAHLQRMVSGSFVPPPFDKALAHCVEARESYRVAKVPCPATLGRAGCFGRVLWARVAGVWGGADGSRSGRCARPTVPPYRTPAGCSGCGLLQKYLSKQCKVLRRLTRQAPGVRGRWWWRCRTRSLRCARCGGWRSSTRSIRLPASP